MRYILSVLLSLLFSGCLYFNEKGVSGHLYDNCQEYYDECGIYHKECPPNLADYSEIKQGIQESMHEIKESVSEYINPTKEACEPRSCTQ